MVLAILICHDHHANPGSGFDQQIGGLTRGIAAVPVNRQGVHRIPHTVSVAGNPALGVGAGRLKKGIDGALLTEEFVPAFSLRIDRLGEKSEIAQRARCHAGGIERDVKIARIDGFQFIGITFCVWALGLNPGVV